MRITVNRVNAIAFIGAVLIGFLVLCAAEAFAQDYPKFLGSADPYVMSITPRHGITVWTGGFDSSRPKQVEKKYPRRCANAGIPDDQCAAGQNYGRRLTEESGFLLEEIDSAVDYNVQGWVACGEPWASFARRFDWSRVTVTVRDTIFPDPENGVMSGGITKDNGRTVWVVNLFFQGWFCCRSSASLATMGQFARWELGNCLYQARGDYRDRGDQSPCR